LTSIGDEERVGDYEGQLIAQDYPGQVATIRSRLNSLTSASRDALESYDPGITERLQVLLDHVLVLASTTSPQIVPTERPVQLTSTLTEVNNTLSYLGEPSSAPTYAPNVAAAITNLSAHLWTWQGSMSGDDWRDAVTGAATTYRRSLGQQLVSFTAEIEGLVAQAASFKQDLATLQAEAVEHSHELDSELGVLDERTTEKLAVLETQIETLQAQVTAAVARQDAAVQQYQEQFSTAQERRGTEFVTFVQESKSSFSETRTKLSKDAQEQITLLQGEVDKAKELVSVFAGAGTANAFGKEAKEQAAAANNWRKIAIGLAILGAIAAGVLIFAFGNKSASVSEVIGKLAVTVVVAGAAGYAATQSSAHRKREVNNRRAELLLVSFEPFVRDLPTEEQDKARVTLLQTLMTDTSHVMPSDGAIDEPVLSAGQLNLIKQFFDIIARR
jgi:hypothetical protein